MQITRQNKNGFTLIETLVAVAIFGMIITAVIGIFLNSWRYNAVLWEQLSTQTEGRNVTQGFANEIRTASQSSIGAYPLQTANTSTIIFYSNLDADSLVERVRYFMSGKTLTKGVIKPSGNPLTYNTADEVLTDVVHDVANTGTSPIFLYYDENYSGSGSPLPSPVDTTEVRVIKMSLKLDENPRLTPAPLYVESEAMLRNLKSN